MAINITFRTQLLGGVAEFCGACGIPLLTTPLHLVELVVLLARYKEEGNALFPEVYITSNVAALLAMLPDAEQLVLGRTTRDVDGIKHAVKKTAPLATAGWLVFLNDDGQTLTYGLFRGTSNPVAVLVDRVVLDPKNNIPVTKVFQVAEDCVEIDSSNGHRHIVFMNHRKDDSPPPLQSLAQLIKAICFNVEEELKEPTESFLTRILYNALRTSHGTLIAVTDKSAPPARIFDDGIRLETPIDYPGLIKGVRKEELPSSRLTTTASLLEGMLNSDGIILFNNKGRLLGFNYFVRAKQPTNVSGGARRRAFATLTGHLNKGLSAAFIQSQDGWSDFRG